MLVKIHGSIKLSFQKDYLPPTFVIIFTSHCADSLNLACISIIFPWIQPFLHNDAVLVAASTRLISALHVQPRIRSSGTSEPKRKLVSLCTKRCMLRRLRRAHNTIAVVRLNHVYNQVLSQLCHCSNTSYILLLHSPTMRSNTALIAFATHISLVLAAALHHPETPNRREISSNLQNILANTDKSNAYTYPTDLTRGILPKPIHSHNDYWRDVPFYTALSYGCVSIEADVWYLPSIKDSTLFVGHEMSALTTARTFDSLYIQPILSVLSRENPSTEFVTSKTKNGVFDTNPGQTLYLFVDVKTAGSTTFPEVIKALQPLRDGGWLTTYNGTAVTPGAVTVIGTGNTPLDQVQGVDNRDYFYDAPLSLLGSTFSYITADVSPIASTDFTAVFGIINGTTFNSTQLALLDSQIKTAKSKGIAPRYWDTPDWPIATRNAVWSILVEHGTGLVNADDLAHAAGFGGINGFWG